ncbi:Sulfotransferase [Mactra antiquata]
MRKSLRCFGPKNIAILFVLSTCWAVIFYYIELNTESKALMSARRHNYTIYSKEDNVHIYEMPPVLGREDIRGSANCVQNKPDVVMIGVPKCGTGSVRTFLNEHPNIAMEMNSEGVQYFNARYMRGNEWYVSQMPCSQPGQITIENSAQYFASDVAPLRMYRYNPDMKLIVTIRNPIKRLVSEFVQMTVGRPQFLSGLSVEENILHQTTGKVNDKKTIVAKSMYIKYIKQWMKFFSPKQIHIVDGDEFALNPVKELQELERFLGIKPYFTKSHFALVKERGFFCLKRPNGVECLEKGKGRAHPNVSPAILSMLRIFFTPYNEELFALMGRRLDWN